MKLLIGTVGVVLFVISCYIVYRFVLIGNPDDICLNRNIQLVDKWKSCLEYSNFRANIQTQVTAIRVLENTEHGGGVIPKYTKKTFMIDGEKLKNISGTIRVDFINDYLSSIWFYPDNNAEIIEITKLPEKQTDGLIQDHGRDYEGKSYIRWMDRKLLEFEKEWLDRFS